MAAATASGDVSNPGANVANYNSGADWGTGDCSFDGNTTTVGSARAGIRLAGFFGAPCGLRPQFEIGT
jgi:hypothetical protein